jgi:hypothetical protein
MNNQDKCPACHGRGTCYNEHTMTEARCSNPECEDGYIKRQLPEPRFTLEEITGYGEE